MAQLQKTAPLFLVADVQRSAEFYRDKLGFAFDRFWGEPPNFCMAQRDGFIVMLSQVPAGEPVDTPFRLGKHIWSAYFWVDDVKVLHDEWASRGVHIEYGLCPQPYNMLEFGIRDLDGHSIGVGQPTDG